MHGLDFLQDLALVMIAAGVVTILFHALRQPVVLGYIAAGVLIGPHVFPGSNFVVHNDRVVQTLSELGVILLMFSLGLEFSVKKLSSVGAAAAVAAPLEILVMLLVGYQVGRLLGWGNVESIFLGAILSISSTTIVVKVLAELGLTKTPLASLTFGILIIEDLLAIAMLAVLSSIAKTGGMLFGQVAGTFGYLAVFLVSVLVVGLLTVPFLMRQVARVKSREMMLVTSLGLCFGVSLLAAKLGYNVALGAFLIGAVVAETRQGKQVEDLVEPVRDMFSAIFFVAVGMMIVPGAMMQHWRPIVLISVILLLGKTFGCAAGVFLAGRDPRTALKVGLGLAQIGEFSFIIANLMPDSPLYQIAVGVSALTTVTAPLRIRHSDAAVAWFERRAPAGLTAYLRTYSGWLARPRHAPTAAADQIRRLLRRWTLQLALNLILVSGVFIAAVWLASRWQAPGDDPTADRPARTWIWLTAALLALPLLIASVRKLRAASMVVAEITCTRSAGATPAQTLAARKLVSNTIVGAGSAGMLLWILLLSSAILPPWPVLLTLLAIVVGVALLMWQSFVRLYAKAQIALHDTLAVDYEALHHHAAPPPLPPPASRRRPPHRRHLPQIPGRRETHPRTRPSHPHRRQHRRPRTPRRHPHRQPRPRRRTPRRRPRPPHRHRSTTRHRRPAARRLMIRNLATPS